MNFDSYMVVFYFFQSIILDGSLSPLGDRIHIMTPSDTILILKKFWKTFGV